MWSRLRAVRAGYDRQSLVTLAVLAVVYVAISVTWRRFILFSVGMDWLLLAIWIAMTALLCWGVAPRRDLLRAAVGLGGGVWIETWGTYTTLWWYFTAERPPVWILPAWPVAAIAIDRLSRALDRVVPAGELRVAWWLLLPPFVVLMTAFVWPYAGHPTTWISIAAMLIVLVTSRGTRQDVTLMVAGSALGVLLEYWGTSRHCWNYYTGEIPPVPAVLAHGFASVSFQRIAGVVEAGWARARDARLVW